MGVLNMKKNVRMITLSRYAERVKIRKLLLCIGLAFKRKCKNDCDPITLEKMSMISKTIMIISPTGHKYGFDAYALLNYVIVSGQARNPITRDPLNRIEMNRLATVCNFTGDIHGCGRVSVPMHEDRVLETIFSDLTERIDYLIDSCDERMTNDESFQIIVASLGEIHYIYNSMVRFAGSNVASAKVVEFLQRIQELITRGNPRFNLCALEMIRDIILNNVVHCSNRQTNCAHVVRNGDDGNTDL